MGSGFGPDRGDRLPHLLQALAPEGEDVGMAAGDPDRGRRRAAEIDRRVGVLHRLRRDRSGLEAVVSALVIHRGVGGPEPAQDGDIFVGPGIARVVVLIVAVLSLVGVAAA